MPPLDQCDVRYVIDGSNVLLGLRIKRTPAPRAFGRLVAALLEEGNDIDIVFDNSIRGFVDRFKIQDEWKALLKGLKTANVPPTFVAHGDSLVEQLSLKGAAIINFNDKMDSWPNRPRQVIRARLRRTSGRACVTLQEDGSTKPRLSSEVESAFSLGKVSYTGYHLKREDVARAIAKDHAADSVAPEGLLLVVLLDSSASMMSTDTYDGRPKCEHLNEVVSQTIDRFSGSAVASQLYIALVRFDTDAAPILNHTEAVFSSVPDWLEHFRNGFSYLQGCRPGNGTNIRHALDSARDALTDAIDDESEISSIADYWTASIVLITDGLHVVQSKDGLEGTEEILRQAEMLHTGLDGLSHVSIGAVGIGRDTDRDLLLHISSPCSATQLRMAKAARVLDRLESDSNDRPRLCTMVESEDTDFGHVIRSFIDVASSM